MSVVEICDTCRFWAGRGRAYEADCRRYPPTVMTMGYDAPVAVFAVQTKQSQWCGEWVKRKTEEANGD